MALVTNVTERKRQEDHISLLMREVRQEAALCERSTHRDSREGPRSGLRCQRRAPCRGSAEGGRRIYSADAAVIDDFSRECLTLVADGSLSGIRVAREAAGPGAGEQLIKS
jgi:hypothetical protein